MLEGGNPLLIFMANFWGTVLWQILKVKDIWRPNLTCSASETSATFGIDPILF